MSDYNKNKLQEEVFQDFPSLYSLDTLLVKDDLDYLEVKLRDLLSQIEDKIVYFMRRMEKYPKVRRYSHKIAVLNAAKNYLFDIIGIDVLEEYKRVYPKWDRAIGISDTKSLVNEAIVFKKILEQTQRSDG